MNMLALEIYSLLFRQEQRRGLYSFVYHDLPLDRKARLHFREQLKYFLDSGFHFAALPDLYRFKDLTSMTVASISFDDGHLSTFDVAYPLIIELKIPITLFVCTGYVDGQIVAPFSSSISKFAKPLDWAMIKEMARSEYVRIGSHSLTHPFFSKIDRSHLWNELVTSKSLLEDRLGIEVSSIAYPYGDFDSRSKLMVAEAGYTVARTTLSKSIELISDLLELPGIGLQGDYPIQVIDTLTKVNLTPKRHFDQMKSIIRPFKPWHPTKPIDERRK